MITKIACVFAAVWSVGCFSTRVASNQYSAQRYTQRQWFLINGAFPVAPEPQNECHNGFAEVKSEESATDVLIRVGIGLGGGLSATMLCGGVPLCAPVGSFLARLIVEPRTVSYSCVVPEKK